MSRLVERVARAVDPSAFHKGSVPPRGLETATKETIERAAESRKFRARKAARAAIAEVLSEMEEPSEGVLRAVADALTKPRVHVGHVRSDRVADAAIALQAAAGQFRKEIEG